MNVGTEMTRHEEARALAVLGEAVPAFTLAFLRGCPDAVFLLNQERRITFLNSVGLEAFALKSHEDVAGMTLADLWPEEARRLLDDAFRRTLEGRISRVWATGTGGQAFELTLSPVINAEGVTESMLCMARIA